MCKIQPHYKIIIVIPHISAYDTSLWDIHQCMLGTTEMFIVLKTHSGCYLADKTCHEGHNAQ